MNVFIHFNDPDMSWTTNVDLEERANNFMETLNQAYNPHHIYFVGLGGTCNATYDITTLNDAFFLNLTNGKAIDMFDEGDEVGSPNGFAYRLPNNYLQINGSANENASLSSRVVHEMGHCLGLSHIFTGSDTGECLETEESCSGTSLDPCYCCGDYVCDTPPTNEDLILDETCETIIAPSNPTQPFILYRNYMSYTEPIHCRSLFTAGQVKRMWAYLTLNSLLQEVQAKREYSGELNAGTYGDIIVKSGTTLTINSDIEMLAGSKIIVERNAQLTVKGTISGACDGMWQGIIVKGSSLAEQEPEFQGWLQVNGGGTIKDAKVGIDVQETDEENGAIPGTGSGIVSVLGGILKNNEIGIRFGEYRGANESQIGFSDFIIDDMYRSTQKPLGMDVFAVLKLKITRNNFFDNRSACDIITNRATGIKTFNAGIDVNRNSFTNLSIGIKADQLLEGTGTLFIFNSTFDACKVGVEATKCSDFFLSGNNFIIKRPVPCSVSVGGPDDSADVFGVKISGTTTSFKFAENTFIYVEAVNGLFDINEDVLNNLYPFLGECDEAAYTAMLILQQNGDEDATVECSEIAFRQNEMSSISLKDKHISIFPNPTQHQLNIELPLTQSATNIKLFDVQGKLVYYSNLDVPNSQISLNLPELINGMYILEVITDAAIFREKVFIQQ